MKWNVAPVLANRIMQKLEQRQILRAIICSSKQAMIYLVTNADFRARPL